MVRAMPRTTFIPALALAVLLAAPPAVRGAKVISMSLGGPSASRTIAAATRYAWENGGRGGSVLVAAAGNDGTRAVEYPAGRPEVVSVGAVDGDDAVASFSNHNDDVELTAPGV